MENLSPEKQLESKTSPAQPVVEEIDSDQKPDANNSLDLHLDISLPEIATSPSPARVHKLDSTDSPSKPSVLLSDEREILKDLQCFEDADSARQQKPSEVSHQSNKSHSREDNVTLFEET